MANGLTVSVLSRFEFQAGHLNLRATLTADIKEFFFRISYQKLSTEPTNIGHIFRKEYKNLN